MVRKELHSIPSGMSGRPKKASSPVRRAGTDLDPCSTYAHRMGSELKCLNQNGYFSVSVVSFPFHDGDDADDFDANHADDDGDD